MSFLDIAIIEAQKADKRGEIPIGAVIVRNGKIIAKAHNKRERTQNALHHAEMLAIGKACKKLKSWRLDDCEMYVTLEPCAMCMGAITNARIKTCYVGAKTTSDLNWKTAIVFQDDKQCSEILKDFFNKKRKTNK